MSKGLLEFLNVFMFILTTVTLIAGIIFLKWWLFVALFLELVFIGFINPEEKDW